MVITSLHRIPYADPLEYAEMRERYRALQKHNRSPRRLVLIESIIDAFVNYNINSSPDWF